MIFKNIANYRWLICQCNVMKHVCQSVKTKKKWISVKDW